MSFWIKDNEVQDKCNKISGVIKDTLGVRFHSEHVYEYKYLNAKLREFDSVIKTNFLGNDMPKENVHYTCIVCITVDSVLTIDKKIHPQVYLEECKYRIKKTQMPKFIKTELKSDSESDLDLYSEKIGAKVNSKLIAKLEKSVSDSDSE